MEINRLKKLRQGFKLTQEQVGKELGFSRQRYNFYETGNREPDNETLVKLADFFSVSTDYLLGNSDDPTPPNQKKEGLPQSTGEAIRHIVETRLGREANEDELKLVEAVTESLIKQIREQNK